MSRPEFLPDAVWSGSPSSRLASLDIFRGLVMAVMIFVNELAGVKGLPVWTYHMPAQVDAMSYVDMVFPAFLFAMGLSLPLAIQNRVRRGASVRQLFGHVALRSCSLLLLGLVLANANKVNSQAMLLPLAPYGWALLALLGAGTFLAVYPSTLNRRTVLGTRAGGLVLLFTMLAIFRRTTNAGGSAWLDFSYWEILGIIGWTYLGVSILYLPMRRWRWASFALLAAACLLQIATASHQLQFPDRLPLPLWPWSNGAFAVLMLAGMVTSGLLVEPLFTAAKVSSRQRSVASFGISTLFGVLLLALGWLTMPLGISKIRATPTWSLASAGSSVLLFTLLYWICDQRRTTRWAQAFHPAGANTLLTYLLPDLYFFAIGSAWLPALWSSGAPGVFRSALFTAVMLGCAALLTRTGLRLRL